MRSRLLILMSLLVLLMQPAALLHGWMHHHPLSAGVATVVTDDGGDGGTTTIELACLDYLALTALGSALPPTPPVLALLVPSLAAPPAPALALRGGTGAGYHARGPPTVLA
jgi:hypothetical protein